MSALLSVIDPYSGALIRTVPLATPAEIERALKRSADAFVLTRRTDPLQRAKLLRSLSEGLLDRLDILTDAIVHEAGKPVTLARTEVQRASSTLTNCADEVFRALDGETHVYGAPGVQRLGITRRFPIGPVAAISPFNFPLNLGLHKVGPALAVGASVIWKPPLQAPGPALIFEEIYRAAAAELDFPVDALQVLVCDDSGSEVIALDSRTKFLSFTGSAKVGWMLAAKAAGRRIALELGGNAAAIIAEDADIDDAAVRCAAAGYGYAGQVCIAIQRVIVEASVRAAFTEKYVAAVRALGVGDPSDPAVLVGPMISQREADRVEAWTREAESRGARRLTGGERTGFVIPPIIYDNVSPDMKVVSEEAFGPVTTIQGYENWDDALAMVNASRYGLQCGLFTSDARRVQQAFDALEVGGVIAGDVPTLRIDAMPYGGVKDSGLGREGARYAMAEMTEMRLLLTPIA
jgi:acyl-CoA reductase-like NAD-dependent aldehyde dehydrogenase